MPSDYDALAWFYDRYWGPRYHDAAEPVLEQLVYAVLPAGSRVLDLCCGTGHLSDRLWRRGYRVIGVDRSLQMLSYARSRVPSALFVCADAAGMAVTGACRAALSTFDSINHVLSDETLALLFRCVAAALEADSPFVFDVNTRRAYESEWGKSSAVVDEDAVHVVRGSYDSTTGAARTEITMFRQTDTWQRADVRIEQRPLDPRRLMSMLQAAGFGDITTAAARDLGMRGDIAEGRTFVRAFRR